MPGTDGFLFFCIGLYLAFANAMTFLLCRLDARRQALGEDRIAPGTLAALSLLGGWLGVKAVHWFQGHVAGGQPVRWAATGFGVLYTVLAVVVVVPGFLPDISVGETLTYMVHGQDGVDKSRLPKRFGPGSD
ncbi:hypothetical protein OEW28_01670 [Defluviimonas sp. WL0002]|uniref:Uncharacterized protein n=1 Tax=Albidovulum marisflavi TaxID=2984159 RepID=A0ABT2Z861_9RHOB|nr:DUF1294 domain-containing protein [Defluviimonas sp. WL0002]MCV2867335.1 hypothetical protein [Defluviimonas sp. WL0002]